MSNSQCQQSTNSSTLKPSKESVELFSKLYAEVHGKEPEKKVTENMDAFFILSETLSLRNILRGNPQ